MPYFKDASGNAHFLSGADVADGAEKLLPAGSVPFTDSDTASFIASQSAQATEQLWLAYQAKAQAALDTSDMTALRCFKAGVAFPAEWLTYVAALRVIVKASTGDPTQPLPTRPAYPANT